jgi:glucokinase
MPKFAIGIDLGGSHITAALVTQKGRIKAKKKISFDKAPNGKNGIRLIKQSVSHLSSSISHLSLSGLGLACPGSVDTERGIVLADSPNLIGWKGTKVKQELEKSLKIPVFIDNDANLAAWGEKCWGAGRKSKNLICLTLGTGVGGGIIINNRIYRGSHFYAAEIGHMSVDPNGQLCSCGQPGHLEALISAPAIVHSYNAAMLKCYNVKTLKHSNAKTIFDAARKGDKTALAVVNQTARYLGIACVSLINIFDPEMVIIGGGVANAGDILFSPLRQQVKAGIMKHPYRRPQIVKAQLGEDAGLLGAVALAFTRS